MADAVGGAGGVLAGESSRNSGTFDLLDRDTLSITTGGSATVQTALRARSGYDSVGNVLWVRRKSVPDPNAVDTVIRTYTYDRANRKLTEFPGGYYTYTWSYDAAGNVLVDGKTGATSSYDALGRPAIRVGVDSARFVYDEMGQVLHAINAPARVHRHYAKNGTMSIDSTQLASNNLADQNYSSYVSSFVPRYDLNGRRTALVMGTDSIRYHYVAQWGALDTITDPFGHKFAWQYDNDGRVSQLTRYAERMDTTVVEQTTYDVDSRLVRRTIMRGATALLRDTLVYDRRGKVVRNAWAGDSIAYTPLGHLRYGSYANATGSEGYVLDAAGNRLSRVHSYIQTFAYDPHTDLLRSILRSASFSWDTVSYGYDSKGNQVSEIHITPFSHITGGIIDTAKEQRITASAYTAGLMTASTYTLDTIPGYPLHYQIYQRKESYRYDALGRRVWVELVRDTNCTHHDTSSDCSNYVRRVFWDGSQILHETQVAADTGAWDPVKEGGSITYVHGGTTDQPLEVYKASTNIVVPYVNWRGQFVTGTCPLAGCSGVTFPLADASAFDDLQNGDANGTWFGTLIRGQIDSSGYEYKRNRYYNPGTGRFTQEDPIGLAGGLNVYGYANGDPTSFSDPFGLFPCCGILEGAQRAALDASRESQLEFGAEMQYAQQQAESNTMLIMGALDIGWSVLRAGASIARDLPQPRNLAEQLTFKSVFSQAGREIAGGTSGVAFRDADRVASAYGGRASEWVKMSSGNFKDADGRIFQAHWVENVKSGVRVEAKLKLVRDVTTTK